MRYTPSYRRSTSTKKVVWKNTPEAVPALLPHPAVTVQDTVTFGHRKAYAQAFEEGVGSLWFLAKDVAVYASGGKRHIQHPAAYVVPLWPTGGTQFAPMGTPCIYVGTVHVEEADWNGRVVRLPRRTFVTHKGERFMPTELASVVPASLADHVCLVGLCLFTHIRRFDMPRTTRELSHEQIEAVRKIIDAVKTGENTRAEQLLRRLPSWLVNDMRAVLLQKVGR